MKNPERDLPKFVIADDGAGRDFAIHLHDPIFVLEIGREETPVWICPVIPDPETRGELVRAAAQFFLQQVAKSQRSNLS